MPLLALCRRLSTSDGGTTGGPIVRVIILGCGRVGAMIATTMFRESHDVTIVDQDPDAFRRLGNDYGGKKLVGNGLDVETMKKALIEEADAFIATTNGDNRNIMSSQIAKVRFNVPKVVARIYDPIRATAYAELGIETICTTCIGAGAMMDKIMGQPFRTVDDYCQMAGSLTEAEAPVE